MPAPMNNDTNHNTSSKRKLVATFALGVLFLIIPLIAMFVDPILILAKYKLRITKGSNLHKLLMSEMQSVRLAMYVYNITNSEEFLAGTDYKLKLEEVGPFVYQEYRSNDKVDFDTEGGVIRFIPRSRAELVLEESIGDPKDFVVHVPDISLLSTAAYMSTYPYLLKQLYNVLVSQAGSKAVIKIDVHSYLWQHDDPLFHIIKKMLPALFYFDGSCVMERFYDAKTDYTLEMGINGEDKFKVKTVRKTKRKKLGANDTLIDSVISFNNTYEGAAFPPGLTPETPIKIYRQGLCNAFSMQYSGQKVTEIGAKAFVYTYDNQTFQNDHLGYSDGYCPYGLLDVSSCWFGVPLALSKARFLDGDPRLLERIEGLIPDQEKHANFMLVEPNLGLTLDSSASLQVNIVLGDVNFNYQARRFSDIVMPVAYSTLTLPELPAQTKSSMTLLYATGPQILLASEIACCIIGLLLLSYSLRTAYSNRLFRRRQARMEFNKTLNDKLGVERPLLQK